MAGSGRLKTKEKFQGKGEAEWKEFLYLTGAYGEGGPFFGMGTQGGRPSLEKLRKFEINTSAELP